MKEVEGKYAKYSFDDPYIREQREIWYGLCNGEHPKVQHFSDRYLAQTIDSRSDYVSDVSNMDSLTPNAKQRYWKTPTEFPLCPSEVGENPLDDYASNLGIGLLVSKNIYSEHFVDDYAVVDNALFIRTHALEGLKKYSIIKIEYEKQYGQGYFVHRGTTFFNEDGAKQLMAESRGEVWDGDGWYDGCC